MRNSSRWSGPENRQAPQRAGTSNLRAFLATMIRASGFATKRRANSRRTHDALPALLFQAGGSVCGPHVQTDEYVTRSRRLASSARIRIGRTDRK